jgi:O-antigen/teichoic acid export membrane protein
MMMESKPTGKVISFIKNTLKFSIATIVTGVVSILIVPFISRVFSAEAYGKINMFFTFSNLIVLISMIGMDNALIRFYNEPPAGINREGIHYFALKISFVFNVIVSLLILIFVGEKVSWLIFGEDNRISIILLFIYSFSLATLRLSSISYRMDFNAAQYNTQSIMQLTINKLLMLIVSFFYTDYFSIIFSVTLGSVLISAIYFIKQRHIFAIGNKKATKEGVRTLYKFSIPLLPTALLYWANNSIAKLMLSSSGQFDEVGVFAMAVSLASIITIAQTSFTTYWSGFMYANYKTENSMIRKIHEYVMMFCSLGIIFMILLQDQVFLLLGSSYRESQIYFALLCIVPIQAFINETTGYGINIKQKTYYNLIIASVSVLINILICYLLIDKYRGLGAAVAVGISAITSGMLRLYFGQKLYKSVESIRKSSLMIVFIFLLATVNSILYKDVILRTSLYSFALLLICCIYWSELKRTVSFISVSGKSLVGKIIKN